MNLNYEDGNSLSGYLYKGYFSKWDKKRNNGSYSKGVDFFSVHWEIHDDSPNVVRLHVESPEAEKDIELNLLKNRVIIGILTVIQEIEKLMTIGKVTIGPRLFCTDSYKSSEAFRVIINDENFKPTFQENINQVHDQIGKVIDKIVERFSDDIMKYFS